MKNSLLQEEKVMKKNLTCHHLKVEEESNMAPLEGDEEKVKKGKGLEFYFKQFAN